MPTPTEALGGEPLVICVSCRAIVSKANAERRQVTSPSGPATVWLCRNCMRLGSGDQVQKYVMKKEKTGIGG